MAGHSVVCVANIAGRSANGSHENAASMAGVPKKHGHCLYGRPSRTLKSFYTMHDRCSRESHIGYADYGGRGIKVCDAWCDFSVFLSDMGERPEGTSLDRIDVNGDYTPSNCRWATPSEQNRNRRMGLRMIFGEMQTFRLAHERYGHESVSLLTAQRRVRKSGWGEEEAIVTPLRPVGGQLLHLRHSKVGR
jgi:hypothetical protein